MRQLKNFIFLFLALVILAPINGMADKEDRKLTKEIKRKAVKEARKEAKRFKRKKWHVAPGALPMEKQLEEGWKKQYMKDENGYPLYIVASGNSVAETQTAAQVQAIEIAKFNLAGLVQSNIAALVENSIANSQLNNEEAASVTKTVAASKDVIAQELGRVITFFEIYRDVDKNVECNVRIGYNSTLAAEAGVKAIRKKLEDETEILHDKLDKLLKFE